MQRIAVAGPSPAPALGPTAETRPGAPESPRRCTLGWSVGHWCGALAPIAVSLFFALSIPRIHGVTWLQAVARWFSLFAPCTASIC